MRVLVDVSHVEAIGIRAEHEFGALPIRALDIANEAAAEERSTHGYQNQTGDMEAMTFAAPVDVDDNTIVIEFGARVPYAVYLERRGLSDVSGAWERAEGEFDYLIAATGQGITNG